MDPPLDPPPPLPIQPAAVLPPPVTAFTANPTPTLPPTPNHPPYAEMITAAISALNERDGSSKRAIAKYIETRYTNLPQAHSSLLTTHLKRLKSNGQLSMVKHSYKLPRSVPPPPHPVVNTNNNNGALSSSSDPVVKRRPGRPPKVRTDTPVQPPVPVFAPPPVQNVAIGPGTVNNGVKRGPGRPPKKIGVRRGPGRPPKIGSGNVVGVNTGGSIVGRGRGRPKKNAVVVAAKVVAAAQRAGGRPRGRPPRPINAVQGVVVTPPAAAAVGPVATAAGPVGGAQVSGKRRGRPPKAGGGAVKKARYALTLLPKKPRKYSGKPVGRPRKVISPTVTQTPDSQLLVAYLDVKAKLDNVLSRIKQTATVIKPHLNNEAAITALEELEMVATANANAPANAQTQPQPQPQLEQPLPEQPPQVQS